MEVFVENNIHSKNKRSKINPRTPLMTNYNYFLGQMLRPKGFFEKPSVNIFNLFSDDNQRSNIFSHQEYYRGKIIMQKAHVLQKEVESNPNGNTARDLHDFFHHTRLKDNEPFLKKNSFYHLAQDLFSCFHNSAKAYFTTSMKQLCGYGPKTIEPIRSKALSILGVLTFIVSSFTTGYGVNHLLQGSDAAILSMFNGDQGEILRLITSFIGGCLLSYIILHLKVSFYHCILSAGKVFKGIQTAYFKYPWTMIFSTIMLMVSLKTNYDGGIALLSKSEYITEEHTHIHAQAAAAFDTVMSDKQASVTSFYQSVEALKQKAQTIKAQFNQFPMVEASGKASSGRSGQGPRYWGKNFVVHGAYDKNKNIVSNLTRSKRLSNKIDAIIQSSGVDFKLSLAAKIDTLIVGYENFVKEQQSEINNHLKKLDASIKNDSPLPDFLNMAFVEYYDLNSVAKTMTKSFNKTVSQYRSTVVQLKTMIEQYIKVLRQIDRSGYAKARTYNVTITFPPMNVKAVTALKKGIRKVKYKSFNELIMLLKGKYGMLWAQIVMLMVLIMSVLIDLADIVFLSPFLARQGKKEAEIITGKQDELNEWEEKFLKQCFLFFDEKDVKKVYGGLIPANSILLVDAFYQLLEEINPQVIDPLDKSASARFWDYLRSDFADLHIKAASDYNERVKALQALIKDPKQHLNRYLEIVLPSLDEILQQTDFTFSEIDNKVQSKQHHLIGHISKRMQEASQSNDRSSFYNYFQQKLLIKRLLKKDEQITQQLLQLKSEHVAASNPKLAKNELFNYNKLRTQNLQVEQNHIKKELSKATLHLQQMQKRTEEYLRLGSLNMGKIVIWWKMIKSFAFAKQQLHTNRNTNNRITSRRMWLAMMGQK